MFNERYGIVKVWRFFKRDEIVELSTEEEYNEHLSTNPLMVEVIGLTEQLIKPVFDIDSYDNAIDIKEIKQIINDLFPNKEIAYAKRKPRMHNGKMKESYRFYVKDTKITWRNMRKYLEMKGYDKHPMIDMSIYKTDSQLHTPNTKHKYIEKKICEVPILEVVEGSLFDCCASYVEENYEDWNPFVNELISKQQKPIIVIPEDDDCEVDNPTVEYIKDITDHLKPNRADKHEDWLNGCFAIIGACKKSGINKRSCLELIHHFSAKFPDKYNEDAVDEWFHTNYRKQMERDGNQYGYGYLMKCLKEDDINYYNDLCPITYDKIKNKFAKIVFKITDNPCFIELNKQRDIHKPDTFYIMNKTQLIHKYCDEEEFKYVKMIKDKKGAVKKNKISIVSPASEWWDDSTKIKYERLVFQPFSLEGDMAKRYYNLFQGFKVQHLPVCKDYSKIERILYHIKTVMANDDEYSYNWILKWLSAIMKGNRTNVFVMFRGIQGNGKSIFLEDLICKALIGESYSVCGSSPEKQFFGNFNSLLENRVITVINEGNSELRSCIDVIKDIVTNDRINIEKKGIDAVSTKNYNNFAGTTNNTNIINVDIGERRFVWFPTSSKHVRDTNYFNDLGNDIKDGQCVSAFYHYLIEEINYNGEDLQYNKPITNIYKQLQYMNLPNPLVYMTNIAHNKEVINYRKYKGEEYTTIKCADIYDKYRIWATNHKYEAYTYLQFETKLLDTENFGITKMIDRNKIKVFKILKQPFEDKIKIYTKLEGLEVIDDDFIDDE